MDLFLNYIEKLATYKSLNFPKHVHIVLGNESCDLDSTVCTLVLSFFISKNSKHQDDNSMVLPLLNISKEEFPLRTENCFVLKKIGIDPNTLFYKNTLNIRELIDRVDKVTLVDHHVLAPEQEYFKPKVVEIFDHRPIDACTTWNDNVEIKIKPVGSCATLITEELFKKSSNILCRSVANMLYSTIIFDTIGLSPEAGKVKELDIQMCKKLEQFLKLQEPNHKQMFDELWAIHNDVSAFTPKQLLVKDLKVIDNILIPGLPMLVEQYLQLADVQELLEMFCKEQNAKIIILMGIEAKGTVVQRDIAFYSTEKNCKLLQFIIDTLKENQDLQFVEENSNNDKIKYFKQNYKHSRKQIIPLVKDLLKTYNLNDK